MDFDVVEIDVHDEAQLLSYWTTGNEVENGANPYGVFWPWRTAREALQRTPKAYQIHPLAAVSRDGVMIATCQVNLPQLDNGHLAYAGPKVLAEYRRRGVGTALLDAAVARCAADERTTLIVEATRLLDDESSPALDFLTKYGFEVGLSDFHRVLDLPVEPSRIEALAAASAPHHGEYTLVQFSDDVPEEYIEGFCALQTAFNSEAPMGEIDLEPEVWNAERVRANEELRRRQGTFSETTLAVAADGSIAGLTELSITDEGNGNCMQGATLVLKEHRGHRLGMALKAANLRALQARMPGLSVIHSWNAEENEQMAAINVEIGFRAVEQNLEMQLRLSRSWS